jgi:phage tail sheath protein FI
MPEYLHPGVYIEEIERGPRPIEGVPTSTAAILGEAERGPITPTPVTSYREYQRWFGSVFDRNKFLPYAVSGFFENGGKRAFIATT